MLITGNVTYTTDHNYNKNNHSNSTPNNNFTKVLVVNIYTNQNHNSLLDKLNSYEILMNNSNNNSNKYVNLIEHIKDKHNYVLIMHKI
jgi:hypothetical protein